MSISAQIRKMFSDAKFYLFQDGDETTQLKVDLSGATAGKTTTLATNHTDDRVLNLPNKDGDLDTVQKNREVLSGVTINYSSAEILTKTLTADVNIVIQNPVQGKIVLLEVNPNSNDLNLPNTVTLITGQFDKAQRNFIFLFCNDGSTPEYLATIRQELP